MDDHALGKTGRCQPGSVRRGSLWSKVGWMRCSVSLAMRISHNSWLFFFFEWLSYFFNSTTWCRRVLTIDLLARHLAELIAITCCNAKLCYVVTAKNELHCVLIILYLSLSSIIRLPVNAGLRLIVYLLYICRGIRSSREALRSDWRPRWRWQSARRMRVRDLQLNVWQHTTLSRKLHVGDLFSLFILYVLWVNMTRCLAHLYARAW